MRFRFNWATFWPRLKTDYKGLLTEYDVQRDSILELCFYIARRVSEYDDMIDLLTPDKVDEKINEIAEDYFATHDFSPDLEKAVNQYFISHPIAPDIENAVNNYLANKDFTDEVNAEIDKYLEAHPAETDAIKQVIASEIPNYLNNFLDKLIIDMAQEDMQVKQSWNDEYNNGTRFVVSNTDYLYYLREAESAINLVLLTATKTVNGQTGDVTLDAHDVGAASTEDLEAVQESIRGLVTGVSSVNTKTGAVVLNAEDVGAAYLDDETVEAGPANKLNADTIDGLSVDEINQISVSNGRIECIDLVVSAHLIQGSLAVTTIALPFKMTVDSLTVEKSGYIYIGYNGTQLAYSADTIDVKLRHALTNSNFATLNITITENALNIPLFTPFYMYFVSINFILN